MTVSFNGPYFGDSPHGQIPPQDAPAGHVGGDVAPLLTNAEALCRAVAGPDQAGVPLYLVPQSRLLANLGAADCCHGCSTPSLDLYLQEAIGPDWRGRGPCMDINDLALVAESHPDDLEYLILATAIHELAHIRERPALFCDRTGVDSIRLEFEALVVADTVNRDPPSQRPVR